MTRSAPMPHDPIADVLLVDRDPDVGESIVSSLSRRRYEVEWVDDDEKAHNCLDARPFDVLVTELNIERVDGMRLMGIAKDRNPDICVVMIAEDPDIELATEAMRQGAYDFQTKPLNIGKLEAVIERGLGYQQLIYEQLQLRRRLDETYGLTTLIGRSRKFVTAYDKIRQAAPTEIPIILVGEAGTGKDTVAQIIHHNSSRRNGHFVKVTCSPDSLPLIERELLGHVAGAFPGAREARPGRVELADQGTLYLDEAAAVPEILFDQLLTTLETGKTRRLGESRTLPAAIRLIISVTPDLDATDKTRDFLAELQRRFDALVIELPPLRDRPEDIAPLTEQFARFSAEELGKEAPGITRNALQLLMAYDWPDNVSELRSTLHAMVLASKAGQALDVLDVPLGIRREALPASSEIRIPQGISMQQVERIVIEETLKACKFQKEEAAKTLGIGLRTLYRKLKEYGEK